MASKYDVHIYAVVRVRLDGIEAASQLKAIARAKKRFDVEELGHRLGLSGSLPAIQAEYADEITGYLVDEQGDAEHIRSRWYEAADVQKGGDDDD